MPTTHLAHKLLFVSLAAVAAVVLVSLATIGGSQAQTPAAPTPIPTATRTSTPIVTTAQQVPGTPTTAPNVAATATFAAILQSIQSQQVPGTATTTTTLPNATATYAAVLQSLQNQLPGAASTPAPAAPAPIATPATATAAGATASDACGLSLANASGGQTVAFEQVELTLPAGDYVYGFIRPGSSAQPALVVCTLTTNSTIYFDARTGQETARRASTEAGNSALNQLRSLVRTSQVAGASSSGSISPPSTGDAGLR